MEKDLGALVNGLFEQIDNKKRGLTGKKSEQLELIESDASILASVVTDLEKRAKDHPEQKETIYQDFRKNINQLKAAISEI